MSEKETYTIDRKAGEILREESVSRRFIGPLGETEVLKKIESEGTVVFVNRERDLLQKIDPESLIEFWNFELKGHVATDTSVDRNSFRNGYYFLAEHWKGHGGQEIVFSTIGINRLKTRRSVFCAFAVGQPTNPWRGSPRLP